MSWTQPTCCTCWDERHPDRPVGDRTSDADGCGMLERCCACGKNTTSGLYVRVDPASVPYPTGWHL